MNRRNSLKTGASVIAGLTLLPTVGISGENVTFPPENSFWEVVKNRRSVRAFKPDPVPDEDIRKIIDAARLAPTSGNQQPWKFLVISDRNKIDKLKTEKLKEAETYYKDSQMFSGEDLRKQLQQSEQQLTSGYLSAPTYIVVLTDNKSQYPNYNHWDGPLAAGYLMLAARALGYGTVHITDSFSEELTKRVFNIPDQYSRVCFTPIGIPVKWPQKEKKSLEEFIVKESF